VIAVDENHWWPQFGIVPCSARREISVHLTPWSSQLRLMRMSSPWHSWLSVNFASCCDIFNCTLWLQAHQAEWIEFRRKVQNDRQSGLMFKSLYADPELAKHRKKSTRRGSMHVCSLHHLSLMSTTSMVAFCFVVLVCSGSWNFSLCM
jgi:hypothetical protein